MPFADVKDALEDDFQPQFALKKWLSSYDAQYIYAKLREQVYGQDEAIRKAAILTYAFLKDVTYTQLGTKCHFIIEGPSGCGKSTFAHALSEIVPCPVICADTTQVTAAGYKGVDAADLLCSAELEKWWGCGILILDELDKLMEPASSENFHRQSLETFLKILDGGAIQTKDGSTIKCDRLLVIGMGAFTPVRESPKPKKVRRIGFGDIETLAPSEVASNSVSKNMMTAFSGSEQFMGRFLTVLHFLKPSREVYKKVAMQSLAEIHTILGGDCLRLTDAEIDAIVDNAIMRSEYGCRGIRSAIWEKLLSEDAVISSDFTDFLSQADACRNRLLAECDFIDSPLYREQIYS